MAQPAIVNAGDERLDGISVLICTVREVRTSQMRPKLALVRFGVGA
jgi:hypothetical protein